MQTDRLLWDKKRRDEEQAWEKKKDEDLRKIKRERLLLDQQRKSNALLPEKKERQEITLLKEQINLLQESNKAKNIKLQFEIDRLKTKCDLLKKEKEQLIEKYENERSNSNNNNNNKMEQQVSSVSVCVAYGMECFSSYFLLFRDPCYVEKRLFPFLFKPVLLIVDPAAQSLTRNRYF